MREGTILDKVVEATEVSPPENETVVPEQLETSEIRKVFAESVDKRKQQLLKRLSSLSSPILRRLIFTIS